MATSLHLPEDLTILKDPHLIGPGCEKDTAREQERAPVWTMAAGKLSSLRARHARASPRPIRMAKPMTSGRA